MLLVKIALYIFVFTFVMYMATRALWLIFFLFNFRMWEMLMMKFAHGFFDSLSPIQKIILLAVLSFVTYLSIFYTTIRMPLIRYIFLAVMFLAAIKVYDLSDIFLFKDYLQKSGVWGTDFWIKQVRSVFSLDANHITGAIDNVFKVFADFFMKLVSFVKSS